MAGLTRPTNELLGRLAFLANTRGIIPNPINATREFLYGSVSGVANTIIYTVASGKKFFLTSAFLSCEVGANAGAGILSIWSSVPAESTFILVLHFPVANQHNAISNQYLPAIEISAGYTIRVRTNVAGAVAYGVITGWVEDV